MDDQDWDLLLSRIKAGNCTPFLGAGAAVPTLPLGREIAERWATKYDYPLEDRDDLARVAQFVGVTRKDAMYAKERITEDLAGLGPPDFTNTADPHVVLAGLPLPVYLTTNYDDFMVQALGRRGRTPCREVCRWNTTTASSPRSLDTGFAPSPATPVVYHLHGHFGVPESLVLTEDDYLDFVVAVSRSRKLLPHQIQKALAGATLLFIGYSLSDWDFRVIHRGLVMTSEPSQRRLSVTVQIHPHERAQPYLEEYFGSMHLSVYWGTAADFAVELTSRWDAYTSAQGDT
jgi:SIR2-like domain